MPFQSVPDTAEAFLSFGSGGQIVGFTLFYNRPGGYTLGNLQVLAGAIETNVSTLLPFIAAQVSHFGVNVRGLEFENDNVAVNTSGAAAGSFVGTPLPNSNALAVKRLSGFTGRSARGRIFTLGMTANALAADENFVVQSYADGWINGLETIDAAALVQGWSPVIVSRFTNGAPRPTGVVFSLTNWTTTDLRVDSRRDRMP